MFCDRTRLADCPDGLATICFGDDGPQGFDGFLDPGAFDTVVPAPNEPAMFLYTSGSTGIAEGRRALAPEPHLGGGDAARARASTAIAI